jgi:hypothetical protein
LPSLLCPKKIRDRWLGQILLPPNVDVVIPVPVLVTTIKLLICDVFFDPPTRPLFFALDRPLKLSKTVPFLATAVFFARTATPASRINMKTLIYTLSNQRV